MKFGRRGFRARSLILAGAVCAVSSSSSLALTKGQQWFVDNGLQIMGLIGDPARGVPFHLSTYQSMGYTSELWEWHTNASQLTMPWGRWVSGPSDMPPQGSESAYMSNLKQLGLGDEENLNDSSVRDQWVNWYNSAHSNPTYNNILLWNNNWGGQISDAALGDFITRAHPDMISFDSYPYAPGTQPAGGSPTNWYGSFRQYRQWGIDTNTPVGFYRQTYASPGGSPQTRAVSDSELRLETFAGLAFNAKSMQDFTYNFSGTTLFSGGSGDNTLTSLGAAAQTINAHARRLGPALVRLEPVADTASDHTTSMMFIRGKNTNSSTYNAVPIGFVADPQSRAYTDWSFGANDPYLSGFSVTNDGSENQGLPGDVILSWFTPLDESDDGPSTDQRYLMVVNALADMNGTGADCSQTINLDFSFGASGIDQLEHINQTTGAVEDVNLTPVGGKLRYTLTLDGGAADLFKFKDGAPFVGFESAGPSGPLYWDYDGSAANNSLSSGSGLGGGGTWGAASKWYNGSAEMSWTSGSDAIFWGTAGTVIMDANQSVNSLTFKSNGYNLTGSTLTMSGSTVSVDASASATISSAIAGSNGLVKTGSGTLILTNTANSYSGGTHVNGGILKMGGSDERVLGAQPTTFATDSIWLDGGTLQWGGNFDLNQNRRIVIGSNGGTLDTNGFQLTGTTGNGTIRGSGTLTKSGAGTFLIGNSVTVPKIVISGPANSVYQIVGYSQLPQPASPVADALTLDGGTLRLWGYSWTSNVNCGLTITSNGGYIDTNESGTGAPGHTANLNLTWSGSINSAAGATLTKQGGGLLVLNNPSPRTGSSSAWLGNLTVAGGTLRVGNNTNTTGFLPGYDPIYYVGLPPVVPTITLANGATLEFNHSTGGNGQYATHAVTITGPGAVLISGAKTETFVGDNTYTGPTTIDSGSSLRIGWGGAANRGSLANTSISNSGTLTFSNDHNWTFPGTITGSGAFIKEFTGTVALTGTNSPGSTTINGGTLQIGAGGTTGALAGNVTDNGTLAFNRSDTITFSGNISGAGGVTQKGPGTLRLTGSNNYAGLTTVSGGTLVAGLSNLGNAGSGNNLVLDGGTLRTSTAIAGARDITIGPGGGTLDSNGFDSNWGDVDAGNFTKNGAGTVTVQSINALDVTVNAGTLALRPRVVTGGNHPARMTSLDLGPLGAETGMLDLADNDLVVENGVFSTIQRMVSDGYSASPDGSKTGIISTVSQNNGGKTILTLFDNALVGDTQWPPGSGQTVGRDAIIGKYTYFGDTNLDGQITGDDYSAIDANLGATPAPGNAIFMGDTNFDGKITGDDYSFVDANLGLGVGNALATSNSAAVPEPTSAFAFVAIAGAGLAARRWRQRRYDLSPNTTALLRLFPLSRSGRGQGEGLFSEIAL